METVCKSNDDSTPLDDVYYGDGARVFKGSYPSADGLIFGRPAPMTADKDLFGDVNYQYMYLGLPIDIACSDLLRAIAVGQGAYIWVSRGQSF